MKLPDQKLLRRVFRRYGSGQMRFGEGWLSVWEAWVMYGEFFWVVVWGWGALEIKTPCSLNGGLAQMFRMCLGPFSELSSSGTASPIYREGAWMVLEGDWSVLLQIGMWVEACLVLTWGTLKRIPSVLVCTVGKLVLIPSMDLEQPRAMRMPAAGSAFAILGQSWFLNMASSFLFGEVSLCNLT